MVMDTRITNQTSGCYDYGIMFIRDDGFEIGWQSDNSGFDYLPNGTYKSVVSERDGVFIPNKFRANPCILRQSKGYVIGGSALTNRFYHSYYGYGKYHLYGAFHVRQRYNDQTKYWTGKFGTWDQNHANLAYTKANAKIHEAEYDAAVALGELKETLELLQAPFKGLCKLLLKIFKKGRSKRTVKGYVDGITGGWLTYRYGIMPLVNDIQSLIELYHSKLEQLEGFQRKSGGLSTVTDVDVTQDIALDHFVWKTQYKRETTYKTIQHFYYEMLLMSKSAYRSRMLGMSAVNFPAFLWETTTLSFTVDWLLCVGDWLRAITPDSDIKYYGNCVSQKIIQKITWKAHSVSNWYFGLDPMANVILPESYWESAIMERRIGATTPVLPAFNPNYFKIARLLDTISLLWGPLTQDLRRYSHARKRNGA